MYRTYTGKELEVMLEVAKLGAEIIKLEYETQRFGASSPLRTQSKLRTSALGQSPIEENQKIHTGRVLVYKNKLSMRKPGV
jgi:hypothetical protein